MDKQRENGAFLIAASIITAIRLRGEPIQPSPKLSSVVTDSMQLVRLRELQRLMRVVRLRHAISPATASGTDYRSMPRT
jgi:hypothetical protein